MRKTSEGAKTSCRKGNRVREQAENQPLWRNRCHVNLKPSRNVFLQLCSHLKSKAYWPPLPSSHSVPQAPRHLRPLGYLSSSEPAKVGRMIRPFSTRSMGKAPGPWGTIQCSQPEAFLRLSRINNIAGILFHQALFQTPRHLRPLSYLSSSEPAEVGRMICLFSTRSTGTSPGALGDHSMQSARSISSLGCPGLTSPDSLPSTPSFLVLHPSKSPKS